MTEPDARMSLLDTSDKEGHAGEGVSGTGVVLVRSAEVPFPPADLARILRALERKGSVSVGNIWGGAQGLVTAQIAAELGRPILAVTSTDGEAEAFTLDLAAFGVPSTQFPSRDAGARRGGADAASIRARLQLAQALAGPPEGRPRAIAASVQALLQPIPRMRDLEAEFVRLKTGDVLDVRALLERLVRAGYTREPLVEESGQVSLRGDILDLFPFASDEPIRIEMFEEEVESLRRFDPAEQRSVSTHDELEVCLASDAGGVEDGDGTSLLELLDPSALCVRVEPLRIDERGNSLKVQSARHERALMGLTATLSERPVLEIQSLPGDDVSLDTRSVQGLSSGVSASAPELARLAEDGTRIIVACLTEAERDRVSAQFDKAGADGLELVVGFVSRGFRAPPWNLLIIGSHELKGTLGARKRVSARAHQHKVKALQSFFELRPGDLVVHAVHGLARYQGLKRMRRGTGEEEHLHLVFGGDVALYVPASRIDRVQRYNGAGGSAVSLDKIGSQSFRKRKEKVEQGCSTSPPS